MGAARRLLRSYGLPGPSIGGSLPRLLSSPAARHKKSATTCAFRLPPPDRPFHRSGSELSAGRRLDALPVLLEVRVDLFVRHPEVAQHALVDEAEAFRVLVPPHAEGNLQDRGTEKRILPALAHSSDLAGSGSMTILRNAPSPTLRAFTPSASASARWTMRRWRASMPTRVSGRLTVRSESASRSAMAATARSPSSTSSPTATTRRFLSSRFRL